jgi:hypothetical protein
MTAFRFVLVIALVVGGLDGKEPAEFSSGALCRPLLARLRVGVQRNSYRPSLMSATKTPFGWVRRSCGHSFPNARSGNGRPHQPGHEQEVQPLTAKIFWMRLGYDSRAEPRPPIKVTGRRLDGPVPPLLVLPPTNAFQRPGSAMLTGVYVPTPGCWEITGDYDGNKLSFVVWVEQAKSTGSDPGQVFRISGDEAQNSRANLRLSPTQIST